MALVTLQEVRQWLAVSDSADDPELDMARESAQDAVRTWCGWNFELDAAPSAKVFVARDRVLLDVGAFGLPIGSTTGLAIATDDADDGTFAQAWQSSDWQVEPLNGIGPGGHAWPGLMLRAVGDWRYPVGGSGRARVQVTARWGWPAVPRRVKLATLMLTAAWHQRRATMTGRGGFDGFFASAIRDDQAVQDLLSDYRAGTSIVGVA